MAKAPEELHTCPVKIPEGLDERDAVLHSTQSLGDPLANTNALGISGYVTSRGWSEIH